MANEDELSDESAAMLNKLAARQAAKWAAMGYSIPARKLSRHKIDGAVELLKRNPSQWGLSLLRQIADQPGECISTGLNPSREILSLVAAGFLQKKAVVMGSHTCIVWALTDSGRNRVSVAR